MKWNFKKYGTQRWMTGGHHLMTADSYEISGSLLCAFIVRLYVALENVRLTAVPIHHNVKKTLTRCAKWCFEEICIVASALFYLGLSCKVESSSLCHFLFESSAKPVITSSLRHSWELRLSDAPLSIHKRENNRNTNLCRMAEIMTRGLLTSLHYG